MTTCKNMNSQHPWQGHASRSPKSTKPLPVRAQALATPTLGDAASSRVSLVHAARMIVHDTPLSIRQSMAIMRPACPLHCVATTPSSSRNLPNAHTTRQSMDVVREARSSNENHWETRLPAASTWCMDREGMYLKSTCHLQLQRHIPRGEAESRSDALAGVQDAASPS